MKKYFILGCSVLMTVSCVAQEVRKVKVTELEKLIREAKTPMVVSFWATFCVPCVEEIPYFQQSVQRHEKDSVKLLLVSLDLQEDYAKIKPFAMKRKFTAPLVWLNETNADYFCPRIDSSWSGAIPATLFVNNKTGYRKFYEEKIPQGKFEKEVMAILGKN